jgi:hypothetical protein
MPYRLVFPLLLKYIWKMNLAISVISIWSVFPFVPAGFGLLVTLVLALLSFLAWKRKERTCFELALVCTIATLPLPLKWPLPVLLGILFVAVLHFIPVPFLGTSSWFKKGKFTRQSVLLGVCFAFLSSAALFCWFQLFHPDLTDIKDMLPQMPLWMLICVGLGWSSSGYFLWLDDGID